MALVLGTDVNVTFQSKTVTIYWTSNSGGNVTYNFDDEWNHAITKVQTDPDTNLVPTNLYDIQLLNVQNYDLLLNLLADRSSTNTEQVITYEDNIMPIYIEVTGYPQLKITKAGNVKSGVITIYRKPL